MRQGSRIRTALGAATVALLAVAMLAPAGTSAAGKGHAYGHAKRAAMQACKHGGWRELQRENGTRFKNQGRCVSYAVRGGVASPVVAAVTITFAPALDLVSCDATAQLADFDLATAYTGDLLVDTLPAPSVSITTDALGDGSVGLGSFATFQTLNLTVDGVSSGDVVVDCGLI